VLRDACARPTFFILFFFVVFARATGGGGVGMTHTFYSTAGLASEGGAARRHTNDPETSARLASTKEPFSPELFQCWRNRDTEERPRYSVFSINLHAGVFSSALPLFTPVPKASPASVAHSPSRSRCLSQTSNPGFKRSHPRHHPCIPLPHQQKAITIERIATVRHFSREQHPRF
jgi:hypothetical protein